MNWHDIVQSSDGKTLVATVDNQQVPWSIATSTSKNRRRRIGHWISLEMYVSNDYGMTWTWTFRDSPKIVFFGRHKDINLSLLKAKNNQITNSFGNGEMYIPKVGQCKIKRNVIFDSCGREIGYASSNLDLYAISPLSIRVVTKFDFILSLRSR